MQSPSSQPWAAPACGSTPSAWCTCMSKSPSQWGTGAVLTPPAGGPGRAVSGQYQWAHVRRLEHASRSQEGSPIHSNASTGLLHVGPAGSSSPESRQHRGGRAPSGGSIEAGLPTWGGRALLFCDRRSWYCQSQAGALHQQLSHCSVVIGAACIASCRHERCTSSSPTFVRALWKQRMSPSPSCTMARVSPGSQGSHIASG